MPGIPPALDDAVATAVPLCVELDYSLISGRLAVETSVARLKAGPGALLSRLGRGRGRTAGGPPPRPDLDVEYLPWNRALIDELRAEKAGGRTLVLVADADRRTAAAVAGHLRIFDEVIAFTGRGHSDLADALTTRFGARGFDFVGGPRSLPALRAPALRARAAPAAHARPDLRTLLHAVRAHQWLKNVLVFLPVLAGQQLDQPLTVGRALLAFVAFSLTASCVYLVNDLVDLQEDRRHPRKRNRPFASGRLPLTWAPWLIAGMLTLAATAAAVLPPAFAGVLAVYLVLTFAYSLKLKGAALIDVFLLAALYTLRVIAGSAATAIDPSVWLLGFCMFFFLSLALVKRYAELHSLISADPGLARLPGRGYRAVDLPVLVAIGVATGCMSVLVLALYVISDEFAQHYTHPILLWQLCPLSLYWIARAWLVVARDEMEDDPLVWAVKDQLSRWVGIAAILILLLAR